MTATASRSRATQRVRRNRITERDSIVVAVIAVAAAVGGAVAGAHPTAWRPADVVLTACFAGFVAWAGASSPWWALAIPAGFATVAASSLGWAIAAGAAFAIAAVIGGRRLSLPAGRALSAGLTINALLRWETSWRFGISALVTGLIAAVIVATGLSRRGRLARRSVRRIAVALGILAGVAILGAVVAIVQAYGDLRDGERALRRAASALQQGDIPVAVEELERSEQLLGDAAGDLDRPWARPALAVPVLGQHLAALVDVGHGASELAEQATTSVAQVNVESLRVVKGVIDVDAIEVLERPFGDINAALQRMSAVLASARSPWLVAPVGNRIDVVAGEVDELVEQTDRAVAAVQLAPSMLGRDGPRTYFVAFTTPAEARGLGGFMGTWAELRADDGRLTVVRTGQTGELTGAMRDAPPVLDGPDDYLTRYGRFGAGVDGEPVAIDFWSNVTMSPDFPSVTDVFAQLYPESGGTEIDGAIAVDVESIARFLELTGPIQVEGPDGTIQLTSSDAVQYLLRDQYTEIADPAARDAVLEAITTQLINDVFSGDLPGPRALAATLGPAMAQGRVVVWSRHPADQQLLQRLEIAGDLPAARPGWPRRRQHQRRRQQARCVPPPQHRLRRHRRRGDRPDPVRRDDPPRQRRPGRPIRRRRRQPVRAAAGHQPPVPVGVLAVGADRRRARRRGDRDGARARAGLERLLPLRRHPAGGVKSSCASGSPARFPATSPTR